MKSALPTGATDHGCAGRATIAYAVDADVPTRLQTGYQLLTQFDAALRQAERRLTEAHGRQGQQGSCVLELFREIQFLRTASQRVLHDLADDWVSEP